MHVHVLDPPQRLAQRRLEARIYLESVNECHSVCKPGCEYAKACPHLDDNVRSLKRCQLTHHLEDVVID